MNSATDKTCATGWLRVSVLLAAVLLVGGTRFAAAAEMHSLSGHVPAAVWKLGLKPAGRLPLTNHLNLAIGLPLRNTNELSALLAEIYDPASPNFRHYLTPEEFTAQFGPTEADYQAVVNFAQTNGLKITGTHPNRVLVDVSGAVVDVEKTFHTTLRTYRHPREARDFYAPDAEPTVEGTLLILHVSGLDNYSLPHPASLARAAAGITPQNGSATNGAYMGNDFRAAYVPGTALTGAGQAVALVQFDGYYTNDIAAYESLAGLPSVTLSNVLMDGFAGSPVDANANIEVSLDIEMVISMSSGVGKIYVYEAPNSSAYTDDVLNRIATDNLAKQISSSWLIAPSASTDAIFKEFAAQGQSYFNASGDDDAAVDPPCDDPYITSVGGTTLTTGGAGGAYVSEKVWNWGYVSSLGKYRGSGGGISPTYAIPSWQTNVSMALNQGSTTMRNFPDVALTADNIFVVYGNGTTGSFGGTSCAAPLWAGLMALVNQQAANNGLQSVGFLNPVIYAIGGGTNYANCFHDTTVGSNTNSASPTNYFAVAGYDLCTGWGTPRGMNFINALALQGSPPVVNGGFELGNLAGWTLTGNRTNGTTLYGGVIPSTSNFGNCAHSGTYGMAMGDTNIAYLYQSLPTVAGQNYLLSFWLESLTNGAVQQFLVNWNTNAVATNQIYYQSSTNAFAWTNLQFLVKATSTNTVLQFGARNDPDLFGLDDISVTPVFPPVFSSVVKTSGVMQLSWSATTGLVYQLQTRTNLALGGWSNSGSAFTATNPAVSASDTNAISGSGQRFYRLLMLP